MKNITFGNKERIGKKAAEKAYNEYKDIFVVPCNLRPEFMVKVNKKSTENTFDKMVNSSMYYMCSSETGKYLNFFVEN